MAKNLKNGKGAILRYPLSIGQSKAPAILFNIHEATYKVHGGGINVSSEEHIALYMVPGISMKDSINYEDRSSGIAGSVMDSKFELSIDGITKGAAAFANSTVGKAITVGGITKTASDASQNMEPGVLKSLAVPAAASAAYIATGYLDEKSKTTQQVMRENPFITFKSVGLREWSFSWSFIPTSEKESSAAKAIIHKFRSAMYPVEHPWSLGFPMVFHIQYINAEFPKMPEVALTSCSVDYNKDSSSFFMHNNEPVRMDMSLSFKELMPINKSHIEEGY